MVRRALLLLAAATACGRGAYPGTGPQKPAVGAHGVEAAALPFHVLDRGGHQLDEKVFWDQLAAARVVCVGEEHPNPHHHWVQLEVVRHLAKQWPKFALGMEMFQKPFQGVLDDYASHRIDETALRSRSGWEERWGYDFALYRPIIETAVASHAVLLALNASKELTKKVVHHGLESLAPDERAQLAAELDINDKAHRAWFDALMEDMGGTSAHAQKKPDKKDDKKDEKKDDNKDEAVDMPSADRIYLVQVIWDETMADTAAKWLGAHTGERAVILAGNGHCHDSAIVGRVKRRGIKDVVSIQSVIDDGQGSVATALARPMNDYLVVLELPAQ